MPTNFSRRHIGPSPAETQAMLQTLSERVMASGGKLVADSGRD